MTSTLDRRRLRVTGALLATGTISPLVVLVALGRSTAPSAVSSRGMVACPWPTPGIEPGTPAHYRRATGWAFAHPLFVVRSRWSSLLFTGATPSPPRVFVFARWGSNHCPLDAGKTSPTKHMPIPCHGLGLICRDPSHGSGMRTVPLHLSDPMLEHRARARPRAEPLWSSSPPTLVVSSGGLLICPSHTHTGAWDRSYPCRLFG